MLLLDELVNTAQVVLNLGSVAVLRDLSSISHLSDVVLEFSDARSWNFSIVEISTGINGGVRTSGNRDIFVGRGYIENVFAVVNQLLTKFLCKLVCLAPLGWAV